MKEVKIINYRVINRYLTYPLRDKGFVHPSLERQDLRPLVKKIEASYLNKVYHGIGIYNDNGGIEFYSDDFFNFLLSKNNLYIEELIKKQTVLEDEFIDLKLINECKKDVKKELEHEISSLNSELLMLDDSLRSECHYRKIKKEKKQINEKIGNLKIKISYLQDKEKRINYLKSYILELRDAIMYKTQETEEPAMQTIGKCGLLTLPHNTRKRAKKICCFSNIFDYWAFCYFLDRNKMVFVSGCFDVVILNSPSNFISLMSTVKTYDEILTFFPNTIYGKVLSDAVQQKKENVHAYNNSYEGYSSLHSYAKSFHDFCLLSCLHS